LYPFEGLEFYKCRRKHDKEEKCAVLFSHSTCICGHYVARNTKQMTVKGAIGKDTKTVIYCC
jgi:hypothetical protein